MHGRNKPALKHSRVCEEEQGMSLQSTRSGSPSFEGRHARRQQGLHRQDQHSRAHKEFMPWIHPVRHRGQDVPTAPAAAWDSCGVEHHPCSHSLSRAKLGRGMGMCQGVQGSCEAVEGCVRGGGKLLSYPHFSLPEPRGQASLCSGLSSPVSSYCEN